jgi:hypothetical protein
MVRSKRFSGMRRKNAVHWFGNFYSPLRCAQFGKYRLYGVCRGLRLNHKRRGKQRLPDRVEQPLLVPNVLEDFNREALRIEIDTK